MHRTDVSLSVVIPVFNEEKILSENVDELAAVFDRVVGPSKWQFLFVNNGSTDMTAALLEAVKDRLPLTKILYLGEPNYGAALKLGLEAVDTPYVHTIDIEQWDIPFFEWAWRYRDEFDIFIGSKRADPTLNHQEPYRRFLSWGLNALLQLFFEFSGSETHGPKLMSVAAITPLLARSILDRGQFDTELVLRATRAGLRMVEVPVIYKEQRKPRNLMLQKIYWNIKAFNRLRKVMKLVGFAGPVRLYRISRADVMPPSLPTAQPEQDADRNPSAGPLSFLFEKTNHGQAPRGDFQMENHGEAHLAHDVRPRIPVRV